MMRLVFSDLRDHAATWIGTFLVAVGCGYIGGWAVSILAVCVGQMRQPAGWVRLICAIFGALPLLAYALSAAASFAGVKGLELVFIQFLKYYYVVALSGLLLGLAAKRREKC